MRKALYVFRGNAPITMASALSIASTFIAEDPAPQVVSASGGVVPLIVLCGYRGALDVDPRSFTPSKDGEINPTTTVYLAYKIYNSSPADVTVDMDDEGNGNALVSCYIQCS
jgi:hypothetical protein